MSRSAFTGHFKDTTGFAPGDYAICWRMRLAMKRMRSTPETSSAIGASLGYLSDSAFKKVVGMSPCDYRKRAAVDNDWGDQNDTRRRCTGNVAGSRSRSVRHAHSTLQLRENIIFTLIHDGPT
ncbi:helix-turn-helix transcriptional regulator [Bradyrhizobium sp. U87765 SZCCT0131]|uniref:helix-turn-helix domain-containing protein n=1 Tax=Bradyrhizobium sp. U87765 SZCCT0109 TaxID=2807656 RepID=UPI001BA486CB|nr:helix-turn-helix transcriptional regulator [Bradyrhizobium sp. U87765 SZCCT0131]MBR1264572.1 helix-turn-helix transcriptional regulator [Bradyrhizobium sp. U87765 SZCCT0134]MBR1304522.1 helix-turn-helix transcriptional regulator [Bradyrhizobium sp. U87765 SZCCT0110]MBR1322621.1 helix-turn-helix transcriptional regulator [Bradyrhizobium sp. U87765 SZCCT0109]MBR1346451.1 helix-turn-helix transcriptional regulator [Bradyrhizobium sp. U87765 SZCCT0048]